LHQNQYDEGEKIKITEEMWGLFSYNCRAIKKRPETRRGLMMVIFTLAQKIFGKWFTDKKETTLRFTDSENVKKKTKCYNYHGNPMFLSVYVRLTDWSKHDLSDFEPTMVSKYKLVIRQRRDVGIDQQIRDAHDPVKIYEKEELDRQKQLLEDDEKRKRALLGIEPPPKRRKTSKTAALSQKEQDEQTEYQRQREQTRITKHCEMRCIYHSKITLKTALKRALAQQNYELMRLEMKRELESIKPQVYMQYESENDKNVQETQANEYKNGHTPVLIQQTHDKWIATQVENLKRRRETSNTAALSQKKQDEQRERLVTRKKKIKATTASRQIISSNKDRNPKRFKMTSLTQYDPPPKLSIPSETASLSQKKQYEQKCIKNNLEKKLLYQSKISLKRVAKRALAQKKYALMLVET
jgi:hypothetical protein